MATTLGKLCTVSVTSVHILQIVFTGWTKVADFSILIPTFLCDQLVNIVYLLLKILFIVPLCLSFALLTTPVALSQMSTRKKLQINIQALFEGYYS